MLGSLADLRGCGAGGSRFAIAFRFEAAADTLACRPACPPSLHVMTNMIIIHIYIYMVPPPRDLPFQ